HDVQGQVLECPAPRTRLARAPRAQAAAHGGREGNARAAVRVAFAAARAREQRGCQPGRAQEGELGREGYDSGRRSRTLEEVEGDLQPAEELAFLVQLARRKATELEQSQRGAVALEVARERRPACAQRRLRDQTELLAALRAPAHLQRV